jgi:hypothetical protein
MTTEVLSLDMAIETTIVLKPYSKNNDYQLNPMNGRSFPPGGLQYREKEETFTTLDIDSLKTTCTDYSCGWVLDYHTRENVLRLIPDTSTGRQIKDKLKIILVIKRVENGQVCLKCAFRNIVTNDIVLITSKNYFGEPDDCTSRVLNSYDAEYKVCQCRMIAPLMFWDELKNRLVN